MRRVVFLGIIRVNAQIQGHWVLPEVPFTWKDHRAFQKQTSGYGSIHSLLCCCKWEVRCCSLLSPVGKCANLSAALCNNMVTSILTWRIHLSFRGKCLSKFNSKQSIDSRVVYRCLFSVSLSFLTACSAVLVRGLAPKFVRTGKQRPLTLSRRHKCCRDAQYLREICWLTSVVEVSDCPPFMNLW